MQCSLDLLPGSVCISPCGGELTVFLNCACFCFDRSCGGARLSDDCRPRWGLPAPGPWPGDGRQVGRMIDETTSVGDGDLTDFGAEHFSPPVAYLAHRPLRTPKRARAYLGRLDVPCDCRVSVPSVSLPIASIFTGCNNPGCATERPREARLRGKTLIGILFAQAIACRLPCLP